MSRARGLEHSAAIKRGLARAKERFERGDTWYRPGELFECVRCGECVIRPTYSGRGRAYCSNACRQAAYRDRRA